MYNDPLLIHLAGNCSSKNVRTMLAKCGGAHLNFSYGGGGGVKNQVYRTPVHDLADFQEIIYAAVYSVTPQILHNTWIEDEYRLDIFRAANGNHVEVYRTQGTGNPFSLIVTIGFIRIALIQKLQLFLLLAYTCLGTISGSRSIKIVLREVDCDVEHWTDLDQGGVQWLVYVRVP